MEYEYTFKVDSIDSYIKYCLDNNYTLESNAKEERTIYKNCNKTIARITVKEDKNESNVYLDFKEDKQSNNDFFERKETDTLEVNDIEAVESILDFLNYKKDITLKRERLVYTKGNVKFEIDSYEEPEECFVVGIEGERCEVDKIYGEVR